MTAVRAMTDALHSRSVPDPLPLVELSGTPYEIGRGHGTACSAAIQFLVDEHTSRLNEFAVERTGRALDAELDARLAAHYLPHAAAYAPELVEEMHGIADGAQVPFERVFTLNCFLDIYDKVFPGIAPQLLPGCTVFGATGASTTDGVSYLAQNLDLRAFFGPAATLLHISPKTGPSSIVFTLAGVVGCAGLNSAGVGLMFNKLAPTDSGPGVPFPFLARKVLAQSRTGDAIHALGGPRRASGSHSLIGDLSGDVFGVEATGDDYEVLFADNGRLAHSNHYLAPRLQPLDREYKAYAGDTFVRLRQAQVCLNTGPALVSLEDLQTLARDHTNYPDSVCRHPDESAPWFRQARTIGSLVAIPARRQLLVAPGPPCERAFRAYAP